MIRVDKYKSLFEMPPYIEFWRDGQLIGIKRFNKIVLIHHGEVNYLSRAQGYKYWKKYFPDRYYYTLPDALAEAIAEPCKSWGYYTDKNGELVGYEG